MPKQIVDTVLPTTMVGSYPRPRWFHQQLSGRDVRVAFKEVEHEEAYNDAAHAVIRDQEEAGLDIVTDGQMHYDDYVGGIGSFCWYMYERIGGFDAGARGASVDHRGERAQQGQRAPHRLGRRRQRRAGHARADPARRPVPDRQQVHRQADQGLGRRRAGQPRLARLLPALQGPAGALLRAGADLQRGDESARRGGRHVSPARGSRRVAAALHRRRERLHLDQGRDRQVHRGRRREDRLALLLRERVGQRHPQRQLPGGLPDGAPALLGHARDRPVRARLRQPRHGRHRVHGEPAGGQGTCRSACSTSAR